MVAESRIWSYSIGWRLLLFGVSCFLTVTCQSGLGQTNVQAAPTGPQEPPLPTGRFLLNPPSRFDVATIRPDKGSDPTMLIDSTPNGFSLTNLPIEALLEQAFGVRENRILNVPGWVKTDRFDIKAKVVGPDAPDLNMLTSEQRRIMLQTLLVDRFGMKFHHDTKELQEYALVITKGGPRLNEPNATDPNNNDPQVQQLVKMGAGSLDAHDIPISRLIEALSLRLGTTIADKTDLKGRYDITLRWTPQLDSSPMPNNPENHQSEIASSDDSGPGFFTAIKEQLGLELKRRNSPST